MSTKIILRFDDICPNMNWDSFIYLKKNLIKLGIRSLLGVIPDNQDKFLLTYKYKERFFELINSYKDFGDTIAQHGTFHKYTTDSSGILKINNKSEFAGQTFEYQYELLKKGKSILIKKNCWQPVFMAPAHSFDEITLLCLAKLGFKAISDGYGFYPFKRYGIEFIPQISEKPFNTGFGVATICIHINSLNKTNTNHILNFIKSNRNRIIPFEEYISIETPPKFIVKTLELISSKYIRSIRKIKKFKGNLNL